MSTPHDGLANVIADVSFTVAANVLTQVTGFQATIVRPVAGAGGAGVYTLTIDVGKGAGGNTVPGASLQCEFSVAHSGSGAAGAGPLAWTVVEAAASTANIRVYTLQFFAVAAGFALTDVVACTVTVRRKKPLPASV